MAWDEGLDGTSQAYRMATEDSDKVIVIAGPGTGKSFAMKRRIAKLLEDGVNPAQILPVIFTNVASNDMHQELIGMSVSQASNLKAQTLHSLAFTILSRNHVLTATGRNPRPLLDFESSGPLMADLRSHGGMRELKAMIKAFGKAWQTLVATSINDISESEMKAFETDLNSWLKFHHAMLIEEVIPEARAYLERNPAASERQEFKHILVDEYQDLNQAEQDFIKYLSDDAKVCIVGDDDQSIYSFKHAHPSGLQDWMNEHQGHKQYNIDDCYRCPTKVVSMANALISNNANRLSKNLKPIDERGDGVVSIAQYHSLQQEVGGVATFITECVNAGINAGDILVLAQRSQIGLPIHQKLLGDDVPVKSYYRESALKDDFAKERFALLTLLANRDDAVALRWLLGSNSSGNWFAGSYRKLRVYCEDNNVSPYQALCDLNDGVIQVSGTNRLKERFVKIQGCMDRLDCVDNVVGQINELFPEGEDSLDLIRIEVVKLLDADADISLQDLHSKLITLLARPEEDDEQDKVRIMSLHKSKGLSSPVTIITGCVEGLLPKQPEGSLSVTEQQAMIEEQRRLFYVGMTRVKASPSEGKNGVLIITSSTQMPYGDAKQSGISVNTGRNGNAVLQASRFLSELGPKAPTQQMGIGVKPEDLQSKGIT